MPKRAEQIAEVIQRKLNDFFIREIEFPRDSLVTITNVRVTPDLKHAILLLSILPITKTGTVLKIITKRLGQARRFLSQQLTTRQCPELKLAVDDFALKNRKIEKLLADIKKPESLN
ncbi:TPA: 30S ribosome-binding factor RbfA [Candidatus Komeilibacteria bacterium]|nr:MAG: Ribosome-binding factor A [Parcubacteria group bacterium GW2011_GWC2_45_15]OGY94482.1 MAG: ribosome-binding factor A [Candidatus Komeilibacteria bacterium RIFOXYC2_FULL_45_12]OGY94518.1 MAG: ribosome-binding factor A [Candidatus Komeilibacteria bacterium RIFOXYA2_FULL_45_9]HAH04326.1 30S ribosome-binding factor RbfA [Candidatus Komeilibacteria bacterium]